MLSPNPPPDAPYRSLPFTMRATGEIAQAITLLHAVETGRYPAKIAKYSLARREDNSGLVDLTLTVHVLAKP
jgi:hypothetical protein